MKLHKILISFILLSSVSADILQNPDFELPPPHFNTAAAATTFFPVNGTTIQDFEDDELLRGLKDEWGEEIYDAVVTALRELHEYNASGCYLVQEFWNFKENRKATFTEVIGHVFAQLKTLKRKRRCV